MNCEVMFEVNGSREEQTAVFAKIARFMEDLAEKGDIAKLEIVNDSAGYEQQ